MLPEHRDIKTQESQCQIGKPKLPRLKAFIFHMCSLHASHFISNASVKGKATHWEV